MNTQNFEHGDKIGKLLVDEIPDVEKYEITFKDGSRLTFDRCTIVCESCHEIFAKVLDATMHCQKFGHTLR